MMDDELARYYRQLPQEEQLHIRSIYFGEGREEAERYLRTHMKRLNRRQFESRFSVLPDVVLENWLMAYVSDLNLYPATRSRLLLTEMVLGVNELKEYVAHTSKTQDNVVAHILRGFRVYRVTKNDPGNAQLVMAYSPLTKSFHRIGFSEANHVRAFNYTMDACYILGELNLGTGPEPLDDQVVLCSLILQAADIPSTFAGALVFGGHVSKFMDMSIASSLRAICSWRNLAYDETINETQRMARILKHYAKPFDKIWDIVDKYGMPMGILGDALQSLDKFRTL